MVRPIAFAVEQWMDKYENTPGVINVAETCASSITLNELISLSKNQDKTLPVSADTRLTYGSIRGSEELRKTVASRHSHKDHQLTGDNVIISQGGISANFLTLYTLLGPTDHVICVYPTYQQLYSVPESLGASMSLWRLREENGYIPDVKDLDELVRPNTKMIIINNPNNPTGALIPTKVLSQIVEFAKARGIILMSDEVYRPLFHSALDSQTDLPPPITAFGYDKTIVTGSMSKAWALAGIRIGWAVSPNDDIITSLAHARDYTTISVSQVDDQIATYALSPAVRDGLLERNVKLAKHNLDLVKVFMDKHKDKCRWVCPNAGTTAFIQFLKNGKPVNDVTFCQDVLNKTKVFFTPGSHCFGQDEDFPGYIRLGYVCETAVLEESLEKLDSYVAENL